MNSKKMSSPLALMLAVMMVAVCAVGVVSLYSEESNAGPSVDAKVSTEEELNDAIKDATGDEYVIQLTQSINNLSDSIVINGKNIVLDLNGKSLTLDASKLIKEGTTEETKGQYDLTNGKNAVIVVTGSSSLKVINGSISLTGINVKATHSENNTIYAISGNATLTDVSVSISATAASVATTETVNTHKATFGVFNGTVGMTNGTLTLGSEVKVTDGTVTYIGVTVKGTDSQIVSIINKMTSGSIITSSNLKVITDITIASGVSVKVNGDVTVEGSKKTTGTGASATESAVSTSLTVSGTLDVTGSVTVGKSSMTSSEVIGNATLAVNGTLKAASLTVNANRAASTSGETSIAAVVNTLAGSGAITLTGTVSLSGTTSFTGTMTAVGGTINGTVSGTISKIVNSGTLEISDKVTIATISAIENSGTVNVNKDVTVTTFTNKAGATITVASGVLLKAALENAGSVTLVAGTAQTGDDPKYTYSAIEGSVAGIITDSETVYGTVTLNGNTYIKGTVNGNVIFNAYNAYIGASFSFDSTGKISDSSISGMSVTSVNVITTGSTPTKSTDVGKLNVATYSKILLKSTDIEIVSGTATVYNSNIFSTVIVDAGATLTVSGALADNSSAKTTVTMTVSSLDVKGTVNFSGNVAEKTVTSGSTGANNAIETAITVSGALTVSGTLTIATGSTVEAASLTNSGTITINDGTSESKSNSVTTKATVGKLTVNGSGTSSINVTNYGTITVGKNGSEFTTSSAGVKNVYTDAKTEVTSYGTITVNGKATFVSYEDGKDSTLSVNGTLSVSKTTTIVGTVELNSGSVVTLTGKVAVNAGNFTVAGKLNAGEVTVGVYKDNKIDSVATVTISGTATTGALSVSNGSSVTVSGKLTAASVTVSHVVKKTDEYDAAVAGTLSVSGELIVSDTLNGTIDVTSTVIISAISHLDGVTFNVSNGAKVLLGLSYTDYNTLVIGSANIVDKAMYSVTGSITFKANTTETSKLDVTVPAGSVLNYGTANTIATVQTSVSGYTVDGTMTVTVPASTSTAALGDVTVKGSLDIVTTGTAKTGEEFSVSITTLKVAKDASAAIGDDVVLTVTTIENLGTVTIDGTVSTSTNGVEVKNSAGIVVNGLLEVKEVTANTTNVFGTIIVYGTVEFKGTTTVSDVLTGSSYTVMSKGAIVYTEASKKYAIAADDLVVPKDDDNKDKYDVVISVSEATMLDYTIIENGFYGVLSSNDTVVAIVGETVTFEKDVDFGITNNLLLIGDFEVKAGVEVTVAETVIIYGSMTLDAKASNTANGGKFTGTINPILYNLGTITVENKAVLSAFPTIHNGAYFESEEEGDFSANGTIVLEEGATFTASNDESAKYYNTYGIIKVNDIVGIASVVKFENADLEDASDEMKAAAQGSVLLMADITVDAVKSGKTANSVTNADANIPLDLNGHTITLKAGTSTKIVAGTAPSLYVKSDSNVAKFTNLAAEGYDTENKKSFSDVVISAGSISVVGDVTDLSDSAKFAITDVEGALDLTGVKFNTNAAVSVGAKIDVVAEIMFGDLKVASVTITGTSGKVSAVFEDIKATEITITNANVTINGEAVLETVNSKTLVIGDEADVTVGISTSQTAITVTDVIVKGSLTVFGNTDGNTGKLVVESDATLIVKAAQSWGSIIFKDVTIAGVADIAGNIVASGNVSIAGSAVVKGEGTNNTVNGIKAVDLTVSGKLQTQTITLSGDLEVVSGAEITGVKDDKGVVNDEPSITVTGKKDLTVNGTVNLGYKSGTTTKYGDITATDGDLTVGIDGIIAVGDLTVNDLTNYGKISASGEVKVNGAFYNYGTVKFIKTGSLTVSDLYADAPIDYNVTISGRLFAKDSSVLTGDGEVDFEYDGTTTFTTFIFDVPTVSTAVDGEFTIVYVVTGQPLNGDDETLIAADNIAYFKEWNDNNGVIYKSTAVISTSDSNAGLTIVMKAVFATGAMQEQTLFHISVELVGNVAYLGLGPVESGYTFTQKNVFLAVIFYDINGNVIASDNLVVNSVNGAPSLGNRDRITCEYLTDGNGYSYGGNTASPYAVTIQMYYWAATGNGSYHLITLGYDMDATTFDVTLVFDTNDGTESYTESDTTDYLYKETVEYPTAAELEAANPGFKFLYWSLTAGGEECEPIAVMDGQDYTYYAVYEALTNTITFDFQGHGLVTEFQTVQVKSGETLTADDLEFIGSLTADENYDFGDWFYDADCTLPAVTSAKIFADDTFYAKYTPKDYTVTFDSKDGSAVDPQTVAYGNVAVKPADPTKEGYNFMYWTLDGEEYDFATEITGDIELVALYKGVDIAFSAAILAGCEDFGTIDVLANIFEYGVELVLNDDNSISYVDYLGKTVVLVTATAKDQDDHNSYAFVKWVDADNNDVTFPMTDVTSDVSVFAVFEQREIQFDVTINSSDYFTATGAGKVTRNTSADVKVETIPGYHITSVTINGVAQDVVVTQSTPTTWTYTENVTEDVDIVIATEISTYLLTGFVATSESASHGYIDGNNQILAKNGENISVSGNVISFGDTTITAVADEGYEFVEWLFNNETYNGGAISGDMKVFAVFASASSTTE